MIDPNQAIGAKDARSATNYYQSRGRMPRVGRLAWGTEMDGLICLGAAAAFVILVMWWHFDRSNSLLHQWAARNDYHVVRQEYRHLRKGPFFWTSTEAQTVYYVVVEDPAGNRRSGWVRCGGWWLGLLSDHVEARWET